MALRLTSGNRFTRSAAVAFGPHGAGQAVPAVSMSCFVRVAASSPVIVGGTAQVFLWGHRMGFGPNLQMARDHARRVRLGWGGASNSMGPWLDLEPDRSYHLCYVYDPDGTRQAYLDNNPVGSIPSGLVLPSSSEALYLGPVQADGTNTTVTLDVTIDGLALWAGHSLTNSQRRGLRDGTLIPPAVAPGNLAYYLPLTGAVGVNAQLGDPGVTNAGSLGSAAGFTGRVGSGGQYIAALQYTPPVGVRDIHVSREGRVVRVRFRSNLGTQQPVDPTEVASDPTLRVDGEARPFNRAPLVFRDAVYLFLSSPAIEPGQSVTLDAAENWVATASGGARAEDATPVENRVGQDMLAGQPGPGRTMKIGTNLYSAHYYNVMPLTRNLVRQAGSWFGSPPRRILNSTAQVSPIIAQGYESMPLGGPYTVRWDGPADYGRDALESFGTDRRRIVKTGQGPNWQTYRVDPGTLNSIGVNLYQGAPGVTNVRVYWPGSDDGADDSFWHPLARQRLQGFSWIRNLDTMLINKSNVARFSDFTDYDADSFNGDTPWIVRNATVTSVQAYSNTGAGRLFAPDGRIYWRFTTSAPHNFTSGQDVRLANMPSVPCSDGIDRTPVGSQVEVLSPTEFATEQWINKNGVSAVGVTPASGTATVTINRQLPPRRFVELCKEVGADVWFCVPHAMISNPDEVRLLARHIAQHLGPSQVLYLEYTNEHWNYGPNFQQAIWLLNRALGMNVDVSRLYADYAAQVHAIFAEEMAGEGIDVTPGSGRLVRVFAGQGAGPGRVDRFFEGATASGYSIDAVAIAPYDQTLHPMTNQGPVLNPLTYSQIIDLRDWTVEHSAVWATNHKAKLTGPRAGTKLLCYEGGWEFIVHQPTTEKLQRFSRRSALDPRTGPYTLRWLQLLEAAGCIGFGDFILDKAPFTYSPSSFGSAVWGRYHSASMTAGLNEGRLEPLTEPEQVRPDDQSPIAWAHNTWRSLMHDPFDGDPPGQEDPPGVVDTLTATPQPSEIPPRIVVSWPVVTGATSYILRRGTTPSGPYPTIVAELSAPGYQDEDVEFDVTYYYVVRAVNASGEGPPSPEAAATLLPPLPVAPTSLSARIIGTDARGIALTWPSVTDATAYLVHRAASPGGPYIQFGGPSTANVYEDFTATPNVTYYYVVRAVNASGEGPPSPEAAASVPQLPPSQRRDYPVEGLEFPMSNDITAGGPATRTSMAGNPGLQPGPPWAAQAPRRS